ncbi:MAG: hypothetical protein D6722_09670, partial [Bacteroidetes bacterium]
AVLSPVAPAQWGFLSLSLRRHFLLVPSRAVVLTQLLDLFVQDPPPPPDHWRAQEPGLPPDFEDEVTLTDLRDYLGEEGFQWVAACALYPECHWDLTRHLGRVLERETGHLVVDEERVRRMLRIPWFRQGAIPDELRVQLVDSLDEELHKALREALLQVLEYNRPQGGSYAYDRHAAYMTVQQWEMAGGQWWQRRRLTDQIEELVERNEIDDLVVMDRLERNQGGVGWAPGSETMRSMLFRKGIPALGINGWLRLSVMGLVVLSLFLYVFQVRFDLSNLQNLKQWVSRSGNIVKINGSYLRLRDARDSAAYFSYQGSLYYEQGDLGSAYNQFDAAVALDPLKPLYWYQRGLADYQLTRYPKDDSVLAQIYRDFTFARTLQPYYLAATSVQKVGESAGTSQKGARILPDGSGFVGIDGNIATLFRWQDDGQAMSVRRFVQQEAISGLDISQDQRFLLTISGNEVNVWDLAQGERLGRLQAHTLPVRVARFSDDGDYILTGAEDYLAILWNRSTRTPIHTLEFIHTGAIIEVDFSPDNRYLLTGSADSTAAVWNRSTGQFVTNFTGLEAPIQFGRFLADSRHLVTAGGTGGAVLWSMEGDSLRHLRMGGLGAIAQVPDGSVWAFLEPGQDAAHRLTLRSIGGQAYRLDLSEALPLPPGVMIAEQQVDRQLRGARPVAPQLSFSADGQHLLVSLPEGGWVHVQAKGPFAADTLRQYSAFNQALLRYETGDFAAAARDFGALLASGSQDPGIYYGRSLASLYLVAYTAEGEGSPHLLEAMRNLEQAIVLDSSYVDSIRMLAPFFLQLFNQNPSLEKVRPQVCAVAEKYVPDACSMLNFDEVLPFNEGLAAVRQGNRWGYIDTSRRVVIDMAYSDAASFVNGLALVRPLDGTRYELIDPEGRTIYDVVGTASEDMMVVREAASGRWGFLDKQTYALRIKPVFDFAESFYRGYAKVQQGKYYGFIDRQGRPAFAGLVYEEIRGNFAKDTVIRVRYQGRLERLVYQPPAGRQMLEDQPVRTVMPDNDLALELEDQSRIVPVGPVADGLVRATKGGRYGFLQAESMAQQQAGPYASEPRVVIEFQYEDAYDFSFGRAAVRTPGGRWGFINTSGKAITDFGFDQVQAFQQEGSQVLALVSLQGKQYYIDLRGSCVAYKDLSCPNPNNNQRKEMRLTAPAENYIDKETQLVVFKENGLWGLRKSDGSLLVTPQYAQPFTFQEG